MADLKVISVLGKDYLTLDEAAFYAGVSSSQFRARAKTYGIHPRKFMGKMLYRKSDIQQAIEEQK